MSPTERKVLEALADGHSEHEGFCFSGFQRLMTETSLDRKAVRRACRSLKRKGLAEYGRGLWTEDGEMAGSGYAATKAGHAALNTHHREFDKAIPKPHTEGSER